MKFGTDGPGILEQTFFESTTNLCEFGHIGETMTVTMTVLLTCFHVLT